ncbi:MAG: YgfZ/GcvT domain-containing protein [Gammaproteobacteria bacterium]
MITEADKTMDVQASVLPPTGAIEVSGDDARAFLQGQLTNDIRKLDRQTSQLGAWCNPQGRVITTLRAVDLGDSVWLLLPADQAEHVAERLRKFVLRARVRIGLLDEGLPGLGLHEKAARRLLAQAGWKLPVGVNGAVGDESALLVQVPSGTGDRFELYVRAAHIDELAQRMHGTADDDGGNAWRAFNVESGLPIVYAVNRELFLPQMLNLDELQAVSFTKGCYAGQEIIARTQNLGRVKRRMRRFSADSSSNPGDAVFADGKPVGRIVEVASRGENVEMLAVVPTTVDGNAFTLDESGNYPLIELSI